MKVLVFGASGQLGREVVTAVRRHQLDVRAYARSELDITDTDLVRKTIREHAPCIVVNTAAFTQVDLAEQEVDLAWMVNSKAVRGLALACCEHPDNLLIHISTDYVFDGNSHRALRETDTVNPLNVYGASKLGGEQSIQDIDGLSAVILRTSSVHGIGGANFVHTMCRLLREKAEVKVVDDQFMSPTYAPWLAGVVGTIALGREQFMGRKSLFHAAGGGQCSWFEFAQAIATELEPFYGSANLASVLPIPASEFIRPAKRPSFSVLDCAKLDDLLQLPRPQWHETLKEHLALVIEQAQSSNLASAC